MLSPQVDMKHINLLTRPVDRYQYQEDQVQEESILASLVPQKDTMLGAPTSTIHLKNRLDSLRKMFDEDDQQQVQAKQGFYT